MEINVNDKNFNKEVIEKSKTKPVLVDFWADWCPPCKMLGPIIKQVSEELKDEIIIAKANTSECVKVSTEYEIMSIPALKIFKDGKVISEKVGFMPKIALIKWIKENL